MSEPPEKTYVYVVNIAYHDIDMIGAYSTEAEAERVAAHFQDGTVDEVELNPPDTLRKGLLPFCVGFMRDGTILDEYHYKSSVRGLLDEEESPTYSLGRIHNCHNREFVGYVGAYVHLRASDQESAIAKARGIVLTIPDSEWREAERRALLEPYRPLHIWEGKR